jgi:hypothetical protein
MKSNWKDKKFMMKKWLKEKKEDKNFRKEKNKIKLKDLRFLMK